MSKAQNSYPNSGNAEINGLNIGKFGSTLSGDPDPFIIYSGGSAGIHDLILFGSGGGGTLNLRLLDGSLKIGSTSQPNAEIYHSGEAYFGGNVGINTTNPTAKLAVDGDIKAKEVLVTEQSADWPDYVFDDGYRLPNLSDLERFIQTNRHLPDIPSAAEIEQGGQNLGSLQAKLLQKIEEPEDTLILPILLT